MKHQDYIKINRIVYEYVRKNIKKHRISLILRLLSESIAADDIHPDKMDEHDNNFEPENEFEKLLWVHSRELAKEDMKKLLKSKKR